MDMSKKRDCNIELLRIVLMMMIILFHLIVHGCKLKTLSTNNYITTNKDFLYLGLLAFLSIGVNCFVFISGYYGIKFKIKTLISLTIQGTFYSVIIYSLMVFIFRIDQYNVKLFIKSFFPLSSTIWWFLNIYVGIYILSPVINKGIDVINKHQLILIIILLVYLEATYPITGLNILSEDGLSFYSLLTIYIIGRFCKTNEITINNALLKYSFVYIILFVAIYSAYFTKYQILAWRITTYNSPFIIINSILFFYIFKNLSIKNLSIIYKIAPLTFGIYLIHDYPSCAYHLSKFTYSLSKISPSPLYTFIILVGLMISIFVSCAIVEYLRMKLCTPIVNSIDCNVEKSIPFLRKKIKQVLNL